MKIVAAFSVLGAVAAADAASQTYLGRINVDNAAFPILTAGEKEGDTDLWVTQFTGNPFAQGKLSVIRSVNLLAGNITGAKLEQLGAKFAWPNVLSRAPSKVFDEYTLIVPDGFLVPGKSNGNVYALPAGASSTSPSPVALAKAKSGWFYHKVIWRDMDGDGLLDILTARATKPIIGSAGGELLWLKQPSSDPLKNVPWEEQVITSGPDVIVEVTDLDENDGTFEVWAAQFFTTPGLFLYRISDTNASVTAQRAVDTAMGAAEGVQAVDLDGDGKLELLTNSHLGGNGGAVYAFTIPEDLDNGEFGKHTLATGFKVTESGFQQAAPGFCTPFSPTGNPKEPQHILVAGDGSQSAYLLTPQGGAFSYNTTLVENAEGTVGYISAGPFLGDKGVDFVVPNYDKGYLDFFTFAAQPADVPTYALRGAVSAA